MNQSSSSPKDLFSEDWGWQAGWATEAIEEARGVNGFDPSNDERSALAL